MDVSVTNGPDINGSGGLETVKVDAENEEERVKDKNKQKDELELKLEKKTDANISRLEKTETEIVESELENDTTKNEDLQQEKKRVEKKQTQQQQQKKIVEKQAPPQQEVRRSRRLILKDVDDRPKSPGRRCVPRHMEISPGKSAMKSETQEEASNPDNDQKKNLSRHGNGFYSWEDLARRQRKRNADERSKSRSKSRSRSPSKVHDMKRKKVGFDPNHLEW